MRLEPCEYSESVETALAVSMGSDASFISQQIRDKICQVWLFSFEGETLGHAVTRMEKDTFVVVAYEGTDVASFGDMIVRICELKKVPFARFHTQRPGLIKLLASLNPEPLEYVVRVNCYGR